MQLYSYADITLSSSFPFTDLLTAPREKKQTPYFTFHLLSMAPSEPASAEWIHHWCTPSGDISISLARLDNEYLLRFPSLADFVIDQSGCKVGAWPAPDTDEETLRHLLLDQVMPRVLSHKGRLVLHASAVCVDGQTLAFVGETGQGKSTLAASFHLSGYPLLTDDGLLIRIGNDCIKAIPGYQGLRLLPESIKALFKESSGCKSMASYSEKNRIILSDHRETEPMGLNALFVLDEPNVDDKTHTIKISLLSKRDACMELVRNSFQFDVSSHEQAKNLFAEASAVVARLPVFSLSYPRDFSCLPSVHDVVFKRFHLQPSKTFNCT